MGKLLGKVFVAVSILIAATGTYGETFQDLVGSVKVGETKGTQQVQVPFIVWGGDVPTFHANGGLKTKAGSIYGRQGLKLNLVPGDDFVQQVRDYMSGKSPLLRGTFRMMGMASEVIGSDPRTKGVVLFQMTWSAGDHAVARQQLKTIKDLKGAKVCLQRGGPHEGLLDDLLSDAGLSWNDIDVVWAKDLTGSADSPASMFRKDKSIDVCFVISPDMLGLTSGLQNIGNGLEGTVKGARVLASTAERSRSIVDVYVVRKDFYDANRTWCEKFTAGYLKACEDVVEMKKQYESRGSKPFESLLKLAQDIYGKEVLPTIADDAYGLILDCAYVGYPGNVKFFRERNNPSGFDAFQKAALDLAQTRGYAKVRTGLMPNTLNWESAAFTQYLTKLDATKQDRFRAEAVLGEIEALNAGGQLDENTIYEFSINFAPNQEMFSATQYGIEFQKVVDLSEKYGNAVVAVRGHSDPTKILLEAVRAGMQKGTLTRAGSRGSYTYYLRGAQLDLTQIDQLSDAIQQGEFDGAAGLNPRETMQAALNLSRKRAEAVKAAVLAYAKSNAITLDQSQIQPVGVGIAEPVIPKPSSMAEAEKNMRVEFRLIRVNPEVMNESDFDF
jgi:ABC-type nitrate/sulfonate/bicarbonate transport system substrate-binding protein/outer membrane protein OmpA-like peptidoglycan-associated protein